jgi:hypothetical protein
MIVRFFRRMGSSKWFYRVFNTGFLAINVFDVIDEWGNGDWSFWLAVVLSALFLVLSLLAWFAPETYEEGPSRT